MDSKLQEILFEKYPDLFKRRFLTSSDTCMCWGLTCDSGWYHLIDDCCYSIMNYCMRNNRKIPQLDQVKEKFGRIRIYFYTNDNPECYKDLTALVDIFEDLSGHICEMCGGKGKTGSAKKNQVRGYILTLCKKCRSESMNK